ncbi:hypothetical protein D9M72_567460 [compost metagenome]
MFDAIHKGNPDNKLLAYQYLQTLPKLAEGSSNKLWIIPSEVGEALKGIGNALGGSNPDPRAGGLFDAATGDGTNTAAGARPDAAEPNTPRQPL